MVLSACAGTMQNQIASGKMFYENGDYCSVIDVCDSNQNSLKKLDNLDTLVASDILFQNDDYEKASYVMGSANQKIDENNSILESASASVASILVNDYVNDYAPWQMDGLFLSEYQILNYMAQGDFDSARIAINQGYLRQQNATRNFRSIIQKRQEEQAKDNANLSLDEKQALYSYMNSVNSELAALDKWKVFDDVVSPSLTYISGLYFLNMAQSQTELEDAITYLKRSQGMSPGSKTIARDLQNALSKTKGSFDDGIAWVIIESGFAPYLTEERIDFPSFIVSNHINTISIAFAVPNKTPDFGKNITIESGKNVSNTEVIADVDSIFMTEFKEYNSLRIAKALTSAITKAGMQYASAEISRNNNGSLGPLLELGTMLYTIGSTSADVRSWYTLPNKVRIASVKKDSNGLIKIIQDGRIISSIETNPKDNSLIYIRQNVRGQIEKPKLIEFYKRS